MKKKLFLLSVLVCSRLVFSAEEDFFEESNVVSQRLEESVITTDYLESNVRNTPKNITVLTSKEIKESGSRDVHELLRLVPGIKSEKGTNGDGQLNYRGQGSLLPMSYTKTVIFVDGIKLNTPDSRVELNLIPLDSIKRIEVIPGGSVIAGSVAGGVVNIITKDSNTLKPFNQVRGSYGSYDTRSVGVSSGVNLGDDWLLQGNFDFHDSDEYRKKDREKKSAELSVNKKLENGGKLSINYDYYYKKYYTMGGLTREQVDEDRRQTIYKDNYYETKQNIYSGTYELPLSDNLIFTGNMYYKDYESEALTSRKTSQSITDRETSTYGISPKLKYLYGSDNALTFGYDGYKTDADQENEKEKKEWDERSNALFAVNRFGVGSFEFVQGYRKQWDNISSNLFAKRKFHNDALEIGGNYYYNETGSIFANYSTNFLVPSTTNLKDATNAEKIDPQTSSTVEVGVKDYLWDTFFSFAIYKTITDDEIYYNSPGIDGPKTYSNIDGETKRRGVEVTLEHSWEKLTLRGVYTYIDHEILDGAYEGSDIPGASNNLFNLNARYSLTRKLSVGMNNYYVGGYYAKGDLSNEGEKVNGYWVTDLILTHSFDFGLKLEGGVKNIFNEKYYDSVSFSSSKKSLSYYPAEERNYYVGFVYNF